MCVCSACPRTFSQERCSVARRLLTTTTTTTTTTTHRHRRGRTNVVAKFGDVIAILGVTVSDEEVGIVALTFANATDLPSSLLGSDSLATTVVRPRGGLAGATLRGQAGTARALLAVVATLADGTQLTLSAEGAPSSAWLQPGSLLAFASSDPSVISVTDGGVLTLEGNGKGAEAVAITVTDRCLTAPSGGGDDGDPGAAAAWDRVSLWGNLDPAAHDVDLALVFGAPLAPIQIGDVLAVDVRLQAPTALLPSAGATTVGADGSVLAFQVRLTYDPAVVAVASDANCAQGVDWDDHSFSCTTNDPKGEVLAFGYCSLSNGSACATTGTLTVATVAFTGLRVGVTALGGTVVKVTDSNGGQSEGLPIVAGRLNLTVFGTPAPTPLPTPSPTPSPSVSPLPTGTPVPTVTFAPTVAGWGSCGDLLAAGFTASGVYTLTPQAMAQVNFHFFPISLFLDDPVAWLLSLFYLFSFCKETLPVFSWEKMSIDLIPIHFLFHTNARSFAPIPGPP